MREKEEEKVVKRERVKEVKDERGECPLCSRRFEFSELEEHAATCQGRTGKQKVSRSFVYTINQLIFFLYSHL